MSEKTIFQKMYLKSGMTLWIRYLPEQLKSQYAELSEGIEIVENPVKSVDVIHLFVRSHSELMAAFETCTRKLAGYGSIWVCYPKLTSALASDINRDTIWPYTEQFGLKPNTIIALDDTWSALRLKFIAE